LTAAAARARKQTQPKELETITGVVKRRIFFNQENGFCVLAIDAGKANSLGEPEDIKATGCMASVREGDTYTLKGNFINNPKFGEQFKFVESELVMPTGTVGVARYLSNVTYGVGQAKARRIVEDLGEDCLEKIRENPSILDRLDYLNPGQKAEIIEDLKTNSIQAELAGLICREGIGPAMVSKIYNKYGNDSVKMVKENPYIIADELWGVGFKKADVVAQTVGIAANSPYRVEAAVNFALNDAGSEGHVYLKPSTIVKKLIGKGGLIEASGVGIPEIKEANGKLIAEGRCIREGDAVYCKDLYEYECIVAGKIRSLLSRQIEVKADLESMINEVEERDGIQYAPEQREAVKMSLVNPVSIITGGPGTGKSTVMNAVVSIYRKLHPDGYIHLAAPTGRAAKRISETTGRTAKTIHRLLQYNPQ
jgi:exodeoxyribonuclease V alpha subunit